MIFRSLSRPKDRPASPDRLPPGQTLTRKWPVLHYGSIPRVDLTTWDFSVSGLVEEPVRWRYQDFLGLPHFAIMRDMHCVTRWSTDDNHWEGISTREILSQVTLKPDARFVLVHCDGGYTTNMPLSVFSNEDCLFAWRNNGQDITREHGWPMRLVIPSRYAWKSAKWVRGIALLAKDQLGFWGRYGYHNNADPWKEERFA